MTKTGKMSLLFGICLIVGAVGLLVWWTTRQPQGSGFDTTDYPWKKTTAAIDGQVYIVEYCPFGTGIEVEDKPYWKHPAKTPEEAAAAEMTCLRTGGTFEDYLRLYADPTKRREFIGGDKSDFMKANKDIRRVLLLGKVRYKELCIVAVKAATNDSPDSWVTFGLCYVKKDGQYLAREKPVTPLTIWLSQNDYLIKHEEAARR